MNVLTIGSRGSNLALIQARSIRDLLHRQNPELEVNIEIIKTYGDRVQEVPIHKLNDKGVFIKELEKALLDGRIDLAVHSMKDMPSEFAPGLELVDPPMGEDPSDVLILRKDIRELSELKNGRIGSGSIRRRLQLERLIPGVEVVPIRGNIETRMLKIETENLDAVILAKAGILRAGYADRIGFALDPHEFLPAPCQGILALQIRTGDERIRSILSELADRSTAIRMETERAFQREIGAGCHSPIGVYTQLRAQEIEIRGMFGETECSSLVYDEVRGDVEDRIDLAIRLARSLKEALYERR